MSVVFIARPTTLAREQATSTAQRGRLHVAPRGRSPGEHVGAQSGSRGLKSIVRQGRSFSISLAPTRGPAYEAHHSPRSSAFLRITAVAGSTAEGSKIFSPSRSGQDRTNQSRASDEERDRSSILTPAVQSNVVGRGSRSSRDDHTRPVDARGDLRHRALLPWGHARKRARARTLSAPTLASDGFAGEQGIRKAA